MSAPPTPASVAPVLAAIERFALLPLLPERAAALLAGPVALAAAGAPIDAGTATSVARTLAQNASILAPVLAASAPGVELPAMPDPVPARATASTQTAPPVMRVGADGRIKIENTPFALRDVCASLPGSRPVRRGGRHAWWTIPSSPAAVVAAIEALTPFGVVYSNGVRGLAEEADAGASARARFVDGGEVPEADGTDVVNMALWSHQRVAVGYAEQATALLLAIPMSGGKTATAIAALNRRQAARVLIVCPNKVRGVWPREVRERSQVGWHIEDGTRPLRRGKGRKDLSTSERLERAERVLFDCDCPAPTHAFVVNYEVLATPHWRGWVPPHRLDAIIYDEVHKLKSPTGSVSKAAARLVNFSGFRLGLSGTPVPQNWWDVFGVFRALDPGIFGEVWTPFKKQWAIMRQTASGQQFPDPRHSTDDEELSRRFHSITYRPVVDLKLPAVTDSRREIELEPEARRVYDELAENLWADLTEFLTRREEQRPTSLDHLDDDSAAGGSDQTGGDSQTRPVGAPAVDPEDVADVGDAPLEVSASNILTRMLRLQQITGGSLTTDAVKDEEGKIITPGVVTRVSTAKADMLAEVLDEIGCTGAAAKRGVAEPVVVFCRFRSDLDAVRELARKEGLRYGEVSGRRGDGLDADSRMAPDIDVCGVQIQAGGTGVDLTRARFGIWYSLGYSVADYDQARSRLVRTNQSRPVAFIHLIAVDTADQAVYDAIDDRRACLSAVLRQGGIDPRRLGIEEPTPERRLDSPHSITVPVHSRLPWEH